MNTVANAAGSSIEEYGPWTDPLPFSSTPSRNNPSGGKAGEKKTGVMRWLAPDWSIVRWVKHTLSEDDKEEHD